jgi:hypothetical protein
MSDEARHGPAGAAQAVVRASSEDRKPVGAGSPPPAAAAHKIQLKSADMKEEMRQEAFEIARVVRALLPRFRSAISLPALDLVFVAPPLVDGLFAGIWGFFFIWIPSLSVRRSRSTAWRRTSRST